MLICPAGSGEARCAPEAPSCQTRYHGVWCYEELRAQTPMLLLEPDAGVVTMICRPVQRKIGPPFLVSRSTFPNCYLIEGPLSFLIQDSVGPNRNWPGRDSLISTTARAASVRTSRNNLSHPQFTCVCFDHPVIPMGILISNCFPQIAASFPRLSFYVGCKLHGPPVDNIPRDFPYVPW